MNQLKKLFIMPDSPDKFLEFGHELLDLIHNFFTEKGGIHSEISISELQNIFSDVNLPKKPQLLKDVLGEIKSKIISHSVKVGSPYYIGHMTSGIPYFMILLEMITAALNQNQVKIESAKASTFVEKELLVWIHRLIYNNNKRFYKDILKNRDYQCGNITFDGTMANLTALLVARNKIFKADGKFPGIRKAGVYEAYKHYKCKKSVILVSKRGHYSINKVARIIGLGDDSVIKIPVDAKNKIDIVEIERVCNQIKESNEVSDEKIKILAIVGIAGTTETGNIDNLSELRRVADEHGAFFHVDAAWGGSVLLVDELRYLFHGIEKADSVAIDTHKLLYCPVSMGMVLFRNGKDINYLKHSSNYIIRPDSVDLGRFTVEGSRPFSALKPWATFKIFGSKGFKLLFEHANELTSVLRGLVEMHANFEPMNHPELFIFNYRFVPDKIMQIIESIQIKLNVIEGAKEIDKSERNKLYRRLEKVNNILNDLNIELHKEIRKEDNSFVSRTMLDCPSYYFQHLVVLRAVTINPLTTPEILKEIVDEQNRLGMKIYKSDFHSRLDRI